MKLEIFSIYDSKVKDFANPFCMHHTQEALRGFSEVCNNPTTKLNQYPEDYSLFHLGSFDSETGKFTNLSAPESLGLAANQIKV